MEGGESKAGGAEDSNRGTGEGSEEVEEGETEESTEGEKREDSGDTWEAEKEETEKEEAEGSDESQSVEDNSDLEKYAAEVDAFLEEGMEEDVVVVDESMTVDERAVRMRSRLARWLSEVTATEGGEEQPSIVKGTGDDAPVAEGMTEAEDDTAAEEERRATVERKRKGKKVALPQQKKAKPPTTRVEIRESPRSPIQVPYAQDEEKAEEEAEEDVYEKLKVVSLPKIVGQHGEVQGQEEGERMQGQGAEWKDGEVRKATPLPFAGGVRDLR